MLSLSEKRYIFLMPARLQLRLHDGLCQQLAGSALLQAALINRLERMAGENEEFGPVVTAAREVEELLRQALEETRAVMRELG